jgi:hypothetical protein
LDHQLEQKEMTGSSDTYGEKIEPHRVKVKLSRHRPEQAVRAQEFEAPRISRQSARECGHLYSLDISLLLISVRG